MASPSVSDVLGSNARALRKQLGNTKYRQLVKALHARGLSVEAFQPGTPLALQARTKTSIRDEAAKTIQSAYAPAAQELDSQSARVQAISDKRAADNQYYLRWLQGQTAKLATAGEAADSALTNQMQGIKDDLVRTQQAARDAMVANSGANTQTAARAAAEQAAGSGSVGAIQAQASREVARRADSREFDSAMQITSMAGVQAKQTADTLNKLAAIGSEKSKLQLEKAAKGAELVASMLDKEVQKADSNRQYEAAATQLNIKTGLEKYKIEAAAKENKTQRDFTHAEKERDRQLRRDLSRDDIASRERVAKSRRQKNAGLSDSEKRLRRKTDNELIGKVKQAQAKIGLLLSGATKPSTTQVRGILAADFDGNVINAAMDLVAHKKLSPVNRKTINELLEIQNLPPGW